MSIAVLTTPHTTAAMLLICAGVGLLAIMPLAATGHRVRLRPPSPTLGLALVAALAAWLVTQLLVALLFLPPAGAGNAASATPVQLAVVALAAPAAGLAFGLSPLRGTRLAAEIGFTRPTARGAAVAVAAAAVAIPATYGAWHLSEVVWSALQYRYPAQHDLLRVMRDDPGQFTRAAITVAAVAVTPLFEELLFRGLLQTVIHRATARAAVAIAGSSLLFAVVHHASTQPAMFVLSVCLGVTYWFTGNLWCAVAIHAAFNALSIARAWVG